MNTHNSGPSRASISPKFTQSPTITTVPPTILLALCIFNLLAIAPTNLLAADFTGKVVGVTDGDTLNVLHNGRGEPIRQALRPRQVRAHHCGRVLVRWADAKS